MASIFGILRLLYFFYFNVNFNFRYPSVQRIFPNLSNKIDEFSGRVGKIKDAEELAETLEWGNDDMTKEETRETFMKRFTGLESNNLKPENEGDNLKRLSTRKCTLWRGPGNSTPQRPNRDRFLSWYGDTGNTEAHLVEVILYHQGNSWCSIICLDLITVT